MQGSHFLILCLNVNDLIYTCNNSKIIDDFKKAMMQEYEMTDLSLIRYFFDMQVKQGFEQIFNSQEKYAGNLLKKLI